ncbi:hypothetical protein G7011_02775 [Pseudomonas plecoglossicida]|uniref:hypothetical protein n=1 Tax=Pseudomonas plecoglossicida TaxID=70775 RepID=UPI0015E32E5A|nr:hypothetical protein [Pseudomonas plecoglossicida]MBA1196025.1 hypothetical protein [Pseudomonas plecoglossicida]
MDLDRAAVTSGTKMVRSLIEFSGPHSVQGFQIKYVQSIMGATLNRRDGSGRCASRSALVFEGFEFNVFYTDIQGFGHF